MSLKAGRNGALYIAQYDLSGYINKFEPSLARDLIDATCMGASGRARHPALHSDSFNFEGFYDGTGDIKTVMNAARTATANSLCTLSMGSAAADNSLGGEGAWSENYPIDIPVDGLIRVSGTFRFDGPARAGYILSAKGEKTEDGNTAASTDAAATTNGAEAYLHVFACTLSDLIIKVQTDTAANFSSPTDLITFTTVTGATSERKTVTGAVEQYVRVSWAGTWAGPLTATFAVIWARL